MADRPVDVTIEKVLSNPGDPWGGGNGRGKRQTYDEVLFAGDAATRKAYVPEGLTLSDGETVKGWFNSDKGTWTIADPNPPQGGGGGGSGDDDYGRRPDHPVQMQRALHTSSMSIALPLIEQMLTTGVVPQPKSKDDHLELLKGVTTWVYSTYPAAVLEQAAKADA